MRLALLGEGRSHAIDQVNLGTTANIWPGRLLDKSIKPLGQPRPSASGRPPNGTRVNNDWMPDIWSRTASRDRAETLMNGTMPLPPGSGGWPQFFLVWRQVLGQADGPRVPNGHFIQRECPWHKPGVAAQMLIGQEEDALAAGESPLESGAALDEYRPARRARRRKP